MVLGGVVIRPAEVQIGAKPGATAVASFTASALPSFDVPSVRPESPALARLLALEVSATKADPRLLYGASPDGRWWAARDSMRGPGALHLHRADGPTVDLTLGPTDAVAPQVAAFSPDSERLAVADGAGALWVVDLATTRASLVARAGPQDLAFGASLAFGSDDRLYVQLVGSVEVPIPSRIGVVDLSTGAVSIIFDDPWAYGPRPLADGGVAYAHLNADGSFTVQRLLNGKVTMVADVGFLQGGIDVSSTGCVVWSDGSIVWIVELAGARPRRLGDGAQPRFAPDGRSVVAYDRARARSVLVSLDGSVLADLASPFVRLAVDGKEP